MKTLAIVGTRPQTLKVSRKWANVIVDTGQHYDKEMVQGIKPNYNLKATEIGKMIDKLLPILAKEKPDYVIVIGDTRSTLAGAVAAKLAGYPLVHLEAGMRCGEDIIEERIRIAVDKMSDILLTTNETCEENLMLEGLDNWVRVGDVEFDRLFELFPTTKPMWKNPEKKPYLLLTLHRGEILSNDKELKRLIEGLAKIPQNIIFPCHPHTKKRLNALRVKAPKNVKLIKPLKHEKMLAYILHAEKVLTDSGGVQREAHWLQRPVIILRNVTEHKEILDSGNGVLVGYDPEKIIHAAEHFKGMTSAPKQRGDAHEQISEFFQSLT